jgi:hypothetical protein
MGMKGTAMKRTTIMLPADLRHRAFRRAKERGVSLGVLIRESLDTALPAAHGTETPLLADRAIYEGDAPRDVARNHDRYLYDKP